MLEEVIQRKTYDYLFRSKIIMRQIDIFLFLTVRDRQQSLEEVLDPIL